MAVIEDRGQNAEAVCTVALCLAIHSNEKTIPTLRADADVTQSQCHREAEFTANQRETLNECCKCCQACHRARFTEGQQTWRYRGLATEVPRSNLGVRMRGFTFAWFTVSMGTGGLSLLLGVSRSSFHPSDCANVHANSARIPAAYRFTGLDVIGRIVFIIDLAMSDLCFSRLQTVDIITQLHRTSHRTFSSLPTISSCISNHAFSPR